MSIINDLVLNSVSTNLNAFICNKLLNNESLTDDEINELIEVLKKYSINELDYDYLYKSIRKIIIFSKSKEVYERYIHLKSKEIEKLTDNQTLEYIKIIVEYLDILPDNKKIKDLIIHYLSITTNINELVRLLKKNKSKFENYKSLEKFIYQNYNRTLFQILDTLNSDEINLNKLSYLIDKLYSYDYDGYVTCINLSILKKVMTIFNSDKIEYSNKKKELLYLKNRFLEKIYTLLSSEQKHYLIKEDIAAGKINIEPKFSSRRGNIIFDDLPIFTGKHIISIDKAISPDLDGAFSIEKVFDTYILDIYISDVPSFLIRNNELMNEAYNRGTSMYLTFNNEKQYNIDMIPPFLSHTYLSLEENSPKNVIKFTFVFGIDGELYSTDISRVRTIVNRNITPLEAKILLDDNKLSMDQLALKTLQELIIKLKNMTDNTYIQQINPNTIEGLVSFTSILVNSYIGKESEFAIYRENGIYTRNNIGYYTNSVTPIRKFVSNINLMFFLSQKKVVLYPDKRLYWYQDNIDEVINHLNERDIIAKFVNKNSGFVKKYINL